MTNDRQKLAHSFFISIPMIQQNVSHIVVSIMTLPNIQKLISFPTLIDLSSVNNTWYLRIWLTENGFSLIICGTCIDSLCEPADWLGFVRLFWCLSCFYYKLCIILFSCYIWSIYITVIWTCSLLLALTTILNVYFFLYIPRSSLLQGSEFFNAG